MLAITIDIEDWYHLSPITGLPLSRFKDVDHFFSQWSSRYDYLSEPTAKVLNMLDELNIKATFFVVADVVEHYPGLVQKIAEKGHEVACHGLHHACKIHPRTKEPLMVPAEFKNRTMKARRMLEDATGQEVVGYRAPNAYIAGWMIDILEEIGFKYDSSVSVNSVYNKADEVPKYVDTRPYYPRRGSLEPGVRRGILEIPLPHFKFFKLNFPTHGGPLLRFFGATYTLLGLNQSLKRSNTVFIFHPIDISRENFPLNSSLKQRLFWAIKGETVQRRIRHVLTHVNINIGTCRELISNLEKEENNYEVQD